jgi:endoglucanase
MGSDGIAVSARRVKLTALLALGLLGVGCIIPPAPRTVPASGAADAPRASMTSARRKGENPFKDAYWVIDDESNARRTADAWRVSRPQDAAALDKLAGQPTAAWFGNWNPQIESDVKKYVWGKTRAGGLPVMIAYNLPFRDCGHYSAGGANSSKKYQTWIDGLASGIGSRRAVVVLEPDGLPLLKKCLKPAEQQQRTELVKYAVQKLEALPGAAVYIDAGHSAWIDAAEMAPRLKAAGIDQADGFALNTSNYQATPDLLKYGHQLSALLGGKHFIIDTGRNGNGPPPFKGEDERAWCNPDGRALGAPPTTQTGDPLVDAFYWLKPPGESDGPCNKGPAAGNWWPDKALELAKNAKW